LQQNLDDFAEVFPQGAKIIKDIVALNRKNSLIKIGEMGVKSLLALSVARRFLRGRGGDTTQVVSER